MSSVPNRTAINTRLTVLWILILAVTVSTIRSGDFIATLFYSRIEPSVQSTGIMPSQQQQTQFQSFSHRCEQISVDDPKLNQRLRSQSGEDVQLLRYFNGMCNGTYIEIGALDGVRYSNSHVFHHSFRWRGVLIELMPDNYAKLIVNRPNEIAVVNAGVCNERRTLHYVNGSKLPDGAVAGIYELASPSFRNQWWKGVSLSSPFLREIECVPMKDVLSEYAADVDYFDFFSVDVEGAEMEVLRSIDYTQVGFGVILVEADAHNELKNLAVKSLIESKGYTFEMDYHRSYWFINKDFWSIYKDLLGEPFLKELSNVTLHSTKVAPSFTRVMPEEMAPKDYKCATLDFDEHTVSYPAELYTQSISNMTYNSTKKFIRDYNPELHDVNYSSHGVKFNYHEKVVHQKLDHGTKLVTVLPAWGRHAKNLWEKDNYWPDYSTAFSFGNNLCFWKSIPTTAKIESRSWSSVAANNTKIYKTVMVSSDFVDNFWHASRFINDWCRYKDSPIHFIIQTLNQPLSYIERFSEALGIADRIIVQKNDPILAETVLFPPRKYPLDWSCLHNHFADDSMAQDLVVIIYRKKDPSRSIPETIHNKLAQAVSEALPSLTVVTFNGNEDFNTTIDTFRRAKIVIGPHGAAMTNLVFARRGIPVVEYLIPGLINRPWGFYIGASIGQKWWPVQLSSFDNELEILKSVSTIEGIVKAEITLQ